MTDERTLADLGEFGLIDRIAAVVGSSSAVVGIGDDTAVLDMGGEDYVLATVDMRVEGVHFREDADRFSVGRWAMVANLSDIAAMGGSPTHALISLAVRPDTPAREIDNLYRGILHEARPFGVSLVGGNITRTSGPLCIDVTLLGHVGRENVVLRRGARPGDVLVVSGTIGEGAAARLDGREIPPPAPRVTLGRALASAGLAHAMLDLSDGLGSDAHHLAEGSGVGVRLHETTLPLGPSVAQVALRHDMRPAELGLFGGEDYELLVAVNPDRLDAVLAAAAPEKMTAVGVVVPAGEGVTLVRRDGTREPLPPHGWRHF